MSRAKGLQPGREPKGEGRRASELASRDRTSRWDKRPTRSMAGAANPLSNPALWLCGVLCLSSLQPLHAAQRQEDTLYMWIDAHQARVLIGKLRLCSGQEVGGGERREGSCRELFRPFAMAKDFLLRSATWALPRWILSQGTFGQLPTPTR